MRPEILNKKISSGVLSIMPTSEEAIQAIETAFREIEADYRRDFTAAATLEDLNRARACVVGKESPFTRVLRLLGDVPPDRKVELGKRINAFRTEIDLAYQTRMSEIQ